MGGVRIGSRLCRRLRLLHAIIKILGVSEKTQKADHADKKYDHAKQGNHTEIRIGGRSGNRMRHHKDDPRGFQTGGVERIGAPRLNFDHAFNDMIRNIIGKDTADNGQQN